MRRAAERLYVQADEHGPHRVFWRGRPYRVVAVEPADEDGDEGGFPSRHPGVSRQFFRLTLQPLARDRDKECVLEVFVQRRAWVACGVAPAEESATAGPGNRDRPSKARS